MAGFTHEQIIYIYVKKKKAKYISLYKRTCIYAKNTLESIFAPSLG